MKFTADKSDGNVIQSFTPGEIRLRSGNLTSHAIIARDSLVENWQPAPVAEMSIADFAPALDLSPDIILFGTGVRQQFPDMRLLTEIMQAGVAIEVMGTDAACRTFNVLIGEQRAVVAALMIE